MGKRFLIVIGIIFIGIVVSTNILYAQTQKPPSDNPYKKSYIVLKGGIFYPVGDLRDLSTGFNGEIAYGYKFHPNAAIELSGGYLQSDETLRYSVGAIAVSEKFEVSAVPVTVAIKGIIKPDKNVDIYGLLGVGAYFVYGKDKASALGQSISISDNSTVFGGFIGAGISYDFTDVVFMGLEGKYHLTTQATLRDTVAGIDIEQKFKVEGFVTTLNLGFRF